MKGGEGDGKGGEARRKTKKEGIMQANPDSQATQPTVPTLRSSVSPTGHPPTTGHLQATYYGEVGGKPDLQSSYQIKSSPFHA